MASAFAKDPSSVPNSQMVAHNYLLTPIPGDLISSFGFHHQQAYTWFTDIHASKY